VIGYLGGGHHGEREWRRDEPGDSRCDQSTENMAVKNKELEHFIYLGVPSNGPGAFHSTDHNHHIITSLDSSLVPPKFKLACITPKNTKAMARIGYRQFPTKFDLESVAVQ
jgi:hypothetical protein